MKFFRSRAKRNAELDDEIKAHLAMAERDLTESGVSCEDARAIARREFGNVSQIEQTTREMWGSNWTQTFRHDVRYALRALNKSRGFSLVAIATLALGIAASTVIFSVADHVVLRPLSYPDANRLFVIEEQIREMRDQYPSIPANAGHFLDWQEHCKECEVVAAMRQGGLTYSGDGDVEDVGDVRVSWNMLPLLGAQTVLGRLFAREDDGPARNHVVVLTNAYWRRKFGADSTIVGKSIQLSGNAWQVIGVLNDNFYPPKGSEISAIGKLPKNVDLFTPLALTDAERNSLGEFDYTVIAKLAPNATLTQAHARLATLQQSLSAKRSDKLTIEALTQPLQLRVVGAARQGLLTLLGAVGAILLIVCVNLTNLLLARQAARSREAALRVALGASQYRLLRESLIESLLVAGAGGFLGVILSRWGLDMLLRFAPADFPRLAEVTLDVRIFCIAALVSILTGLLFGVLPAVRVARVLPASALKSASRNVTDGRSAVRTRSVFVASQIGLSATLLYATGLFLSSYVRVLDVDKGFTKTRVLALDIVLPFFLPDQRAAFYDEAFLKLKAIPGAEAAGVTTALPLEGESQVNDISFENDQRPRSERPLASITQVSGEYFSALGIAAVRGRLFSEADKGRHVVVLSEHSAETLWPGDDPIGKRIIPGNDPLSEVIGIVRDPRTSSIEREGTGTVYTPYWNRPPARSTLVISASVDPAQLAAPVRAAIRDAGAGITVSNIRSVEQVVSMAVAPRRFQLLLLLLFAINALLIASIGIYGIISHSLVKRSNEIGVRMALGAGRGRIHQMVITEMINAVAIGLAVGLGVSIVAGFAVRTLLFGITPVDLTTVLAVVAVLLTVSVVACLVPAYRATRGGALSALRAD